MAPCTWQLVLAFFVVSTEGMRIKRENMQKKLAKSSGRQTADEVAPALVALANAAASNSLPNPRDTGTGQNVYGNSNLLAEAGTAGPLGIFPATPPDRFGDFFGDLEVLHRKELAEDKEVDEIDEMVEQFVTEYGSAWLDQDDLEGGVDEVRAARARQEAADAKAEMLKVQGIKAELKRLQDNLDGLADLSTNIDKALSNASHETPEKQLAGDGTIEAPEDMDGFANFVSRVNTRETKDNNTEGELDKSFQVFDADGDGTISTLELRSMLTNLQEKMRDEAAELQANLAKAAAAEEAISRKMALSQPGKHEAAARQEALPEAAAAAEAAVLTAEAPAVLVATEADPERLQEQIRKLEELAKLDMHDEDASAKVMGRAGGTGCKGEGCRRDGHHTYAMGTNHRVEAPAKNAMDTNRLPVAPSAPVAPGAPGAPMAPGAPVAPAPVATGRQAKRVTNRPTETDRPPSAAPSGGRSDETAVEKKLVADLLEAHAQTLVPGASVILQGFEGGLLEHFKHLNGKSGTILLKDPNGNVHVSLEKGERLSGGENVIVANAWNLKASPRDPFEVLIHNSEPVLNNFRHKNFVAEPRPEAGYVAVSLGLNGLDPYKLSQFKNLIEVVSLRIRQFITQECASGDFPGELHFVAPQEGSSSPLMVLSWIQLPTMQLAQYCSEKIASSGRTFSKTLATSLQLIDGIKQVMRSRITISDLKVPDAQATPPGHATDLDIAMENAKSHARESKWIFDSGAGTAYALGIFALMAQALDPPPVPEEPIDPADYHEVFDCPKEGASRKKPCNTYDQFTDCAKESGCEPHFEGCRPIMDSDFPAFRTSEFAGRTYDKPCNTLPKAFGAGACDSDCRCMTCPSSGDCVQVAAKMEADDEDGRFWPKMKNCLPSSGSNKWQPVGDTEGID